jgi:hypothetical protein
MAGLAGERLRTVRLGGIGAVVGVVRRVPKPTATSMRRFDEIERQLMDANPSVLPARFGTCAATLDELAASVRDRRPGIRRGLRLVRQRAQMTVRIFAGSESSPNPFRVHSEPVQSRLRTGSEYGDGATQGTQYLQRRMAETQIPGAGPLRVAVAQWVRAERTERQRLGTLAGTLYHLVPRSSVEAYRRALERAAVEAGVRATVTGPWPPYAFADATDK